MLVYVVEYTCDGPLCSVAFPGPFEFYIIIIILNNVNPKNGAFPPSIVACEFDIVVVCFYYVELYPFRYHHKTTESPTSTNSYHFLL